MDCFNWDISYYFACSAAHHVHFPESESDEHVSEISIEEDSDGRLIINVGYLKVKHQYSIRFKIKDSLGSLMVMYDDEEQKNRINVVEYEQTEDGSYYYYY